ncbi:MAG: HAD family hydrolase [Pseudomonadota bacterium]
MLQTLCFDADDTLWHNERFFKLSQDRFAELLADHAPRAHLAQHLLAAERRNLGRYGFGIKGFMLSMIETALDVTDDRVPGHVIREIVSLGQEMLRHPIELLPEVEETVGALAPRYRMVLITKGDLLDQERKVAQSGLGELFDGVEIVSDKTPTVYAEIFARYGTPPDATLMTGNSLKSDINPVLQAGGWAVHVPHDLEWDVEADTTPTDHPRFREATHFGQLPALIGQINTTSGA